jgi:hypothetical protein
MLKSRGPGAQSPSLRAGKSECNRSAARGSALGRRAIVLPSSAASSIKPSSTRSASSRAASNEVMLAARVSSSSAFSSSDSADISLGKASVSCCLKSQAISANTSGAECDANPASRGAPSVGGMAVQLAVDSQHWERSIEPRLNGSANIRGAARGQPLDLLDHPTLHVCTGVGCALGCVNVSRKPGNGLPNTIDRSRNAAFPEFRQLDRAPCASIGPAGSWRHDSGASLRRSTTHNSACNPGE